MSYSICCTEGCLQKPGAKPDLSLHSEALKHQAPGSWVAPPKAWLQIAKYSSRSPQKPNTQNHNYKQAKRQSTRTNGQQQEPGHCTCTACLAKSRERERERGGNGRHEPRSKLLVVPASEIFQTSLQYEAVPKSGSPNMETSDSRLFMIQATYVSIRNAYVLNPASEPCLERGYTGIAQDPFISLVPACTICSKPRCRCGADGACLCKNSLERGAHVIYVYCNPV